MGFVASGAQAQETVGICDRTQQVRDTILSQTPTDDTCDRVLVSEMAGITFLLLSGRLGSRITSLQSEDFAGLPDLRTLALNHNQLNELPAGIFSGLSNLGALSLLGNPGDPFKLTVRFEPQRLEDDFTATEVRVVLREGAPTTVTVPLSATGTGGALFNSPDSLTIPRGSIRSDPALVIPGEGFFRLAQGEPQWNSADQFGYEIVKGPPLTAGGVRMKVRVFLEGALE